MTDSMCIAALKQATRALQVATKHAPTGPVTDLIDDAWHTINSAIEELEHPEEPS